MFPTTAAGTEYTQETHASQPTETISEWTTDLPVRANTANRIKYRSWGDILGGPGVTTLSSHRRGPSFHPWLEN